MESDVLSVKKKVLAITLNVTFQYCSDFQQQKSIKGLLKCTVQRYMSEAKIRDNDDI